MNACFPSALLNGSKGAFTLILKIFDQIVCFIGCHVPASKKVRGLPPSFASLFITMGVLPFVRCLYTRRKGWKILERSCCYMLDGTDCMQERREEEGEGTLV